MLRLSVVGLIAAHTARAQIPRGMDSNQRLPSVLPPALESRRSQLGVADRVLDVLMTQVGLQRARVSAGIRLVESAGVPQHMRVRLDLEPGSLASPVDQLLKVGHCHRRTALGQE